MPIFTSQLGRIENQTPDEAVKTLANYVRKIQDELEYRLSCLDSSNISEIDVSSTPLYLNGEPINNMLEDERGYLSQLTQDVLGISAKVEAQEQSINTLEMTSGQLQLSVKSVQTELSHTLSFSAGGLIVSNQDGEAVTIQGGQIDADTLKVKAANVEGTLDAGSISLLGLVSIKRKIENDDGTHTITSPYGYVGTSFAGDTPGVMICSANVHSHFLATSGGAKMSYYIDAEVTNDRSIWVTETGCFSSITMQVYSDRRLKNSISHDLSAEEKMFASLKPCSYRMNSEGEDGKTHWGFIAQEVIAAAEDVGMDAEKLAVIGESDGMYGLAYGEITALNTHMIQKLMARIEALEAKA